MVVPCVEKHRASLFKALKKRLLGVKDYPIYSDGGTPNCFLKEVETANKSKTA